MMPIRLFIKGLPLSWDPQIRQSYHCSQSATMDSSQLCTCPAVSWPGRGRHYLLVAKQTPQ